MVHDLRSASLAVSGEAMTQTPDTDELRVLVANLRDAVKRCSERMSGITQVPFFSIPADRKRDVDLLMSEAADVIEQSLDRLTPSAASIALGLDKGRAP